jgi:hypothetical protein
VEKGGEDYGAVPVCPIGQFLCQVTNLAGRIKPKRKGEKKRMKDTCTASNAVRCKCE